MRGYVTLEGLMIDNELRPANGEAVQTSIPVPSTNAVSDEAMQLLGQCQRQCWSLDSTRHVVVLLGCPTASKILEPRERTKWKAVPSHPSSSHSTREQTDAQEHAWT